MLGTCRAADGSPLRVRSACRQQILSGPDRIDRSSGTSAIQPAMVEVGESGWGWAGLATYALKQLLISEAISGVCAPDCYL